ncbi:CCA tRNA nucleotidyltransferase [Fusobacterium russii]|uniref:CCA tRNA nucleotidyltransferase n=1 Tax=Fusobacterium russii TaxID=854 RepID=UPI00039BF1C9|nr:CCA tRNA nucleotidyltransferase [Fusobacterium russii]
MLKKFDLKIDKDIDEVFQLLKQNSKAYIVGGYVRDRLLGIEPKDCDFCTTLSLDEIFKLFSDKEKFHLSIISEALNIVKLRYKKKNYEIARLRKDLEYYSNRKDFDFIFVDDIEKDLPRRDFTINSIAYDGENLIYTDEENLKDIERREIRFVGEAGKRILEDPFRMLRLFRFFSEKSLLEIDNAALEAINKHKNLIWTLPKEMINKEFIAIIKGENYLNTFYYINKVKLFDEEFNITDYKESYEERLRELFRNSDLSLLEKLNFSKKMIIKIKNKI